MPMIFGMFGTTDLLIIGFIALLLFGNRLPSMMRSLGQGVQEFKKGVAGDEEDPDHVANDGGRRNDETRKLPQDKKGVAGLDDDRGSRDSDGRTIDEDRKVPVQRSV